MSKILYRLFVLLFISVTSIAYSSSIDYRGNQSADYIRTLSRNATTDGADAVFYNPAGTAFMDNGLHFNLGVQHLFKDYRAETATDEYKSDYPSHFVPNLYGIYKQDNWAAYAGFSITAGGGTVKFEEGIPLMPAVAPLIAFAAGPPVDGATFTKGNMEASSIYYGFIVGGAYAVNDMFSFSLGARALYSKKEYSGEASYNLLMGATTVGSTTLELDSEQTAMGYGAILGVDIKPLKGLNIGIHYESKTKLDFEASTSKNDFATVLPHLVDGEKQRKDLPAVLALGVGYDLTADLHLSSSFSYYFITQADAGSDDAYSDDYDNGYDLSIALQYKGIKNLELSAGYLYSDIGANEDTVNDLDMTLDAHNYAVGAKYEVVKDLQLILGYTFSQYKSLEDSTGSTEYSKTVHTLAYGLEYKL